MHLVHRVPSEVIPIVRYEDSAGELRVWRRRWCVVRCLIELQGRSSGPRDDAHCNSRSTAGGTSNPVSPCHRPRFSTVGAPHTTGQQQPAVSLAMHRPSPRPLATPERHTAAAGPTASRPAHPFPNPNKNLTNPSPRAKLPPHGRHAVPSGVPSATASAPAPHSPR